MAERWRIRQVRETRGLSNAEAVDIRKGAIHWGSRTFVSTKLWSLLEKLSELFGDHIGLVDRHQMIGVVD